MEYWGFSLCPGSADGEDRRSIHQLLDRVQAAEDAGLDGWSFAEHHFNARYSLTPSPNLMVAAASQRTTRLRLGNMVTVLPYHHPLRVAEEIRVLDALTDGRLEIGFGPGGFPQEQAAFGLEPSEVREMFETSLSLVLDFLGDVPIDYDTTWWHGKGAFVAPATTQRPRPPLWLAIISDASLTRAARLGLHCNTSFAYPALLEHRLRLYDEEWQRQRPQLRRGKFGVLVQVVVAETEAEAVRHGKEPMLERLGLLVKSFGARPGGAEDPAARDRARIHEHVSGLSFAGLIAESLVIFGSVDQCVEQLERLRTAGVDTITAWVHFDGLDASFAEQSIRLLGEEVAPRLEGRDRLSAPRPPDRRREVPAEA